MLRPLGVPKKVQKDLRSSTVAIMREVINKSLLLGLESGIAREI
jgi:hypothetical protein